jgi:CspA family cold shock protein
VRVRASQNSKGWGVIDSGETPVGRWAHFSHLRMDGYRTLQPGKAVEFTWEAGEQDGYSFRAVAVHPIEGKSANVSERARQ